jgi:hypothetical protein
MNEVRFTQTNTRIIIYKADLRKDNNKEVKRQCSTTTCMQTTRNTFRQEAASQQPVYCVCRNVDNGSFMIECGRCKDWYDISLTCSRFHGYCIGVDEKAVEDIETYFCPECSEIDEDIDSVDSEDYEKDSEDSNDEKEDEDEEIYKEAGPSRTKALRNPTHQHQEAAEETMTHNHGYAKHALTSLVMSRLVKNNNTRSS